MIFFIRYTELREALDSLLAQTCGDFEAIAVNDGSSDNSLEILKEYAARDSRIRILDGPNGGYGQALNLGMDAATGKYMAILKPNDYLPRDAYATLLPLAEEHQLDVVRGTYCSFFEMEGERKFQYVIPLRRPNETFCPRNELPGVLEFGTHIWTGLYCLSFLQKHGIRFHESPGASYQDTGFFFLTAAYAERYMLSDEVAYIYRTDNPKSSINTPGDKRNVRLKEYEYIREALSHTTPGGGELSFWGTGARADECTGNDLPLYGAAAGITSAGAGGAFVQVRHCDSV